MRKITLWILGLCTLVCTAQQPTERPNLLEEMTGVVVDQDEAVALLLMTRIYGEEGMKALTEEPKSPTTQPQESAQSQPTTEDSPTPITEPDEKAQDKLQAERQRAMREAKARELKRKRERDTLLNASTYRVQVFSSNEQHNSKANAVQVEQMLKGNISKPIYVVYAPPFWKVRVGDFKSHEEAVKYKDMLIKQFPQLASEAYVVREK